MCSNPDPCLGFARKQFIHLPSAVKRKAGSLWSSKLRTILYLFFQGSLKVGTRITSMKYIQPGDYGRGVKVSVERENVKCQRLTKVKPPLNRSLWIRNWIATYPSPQSTHYPGQMILQRSRRPVRVTPIQKPASGSGTPTWRQRRGSSKWTNNSDRKKVSSRQRLRAATAILNRVQRILLRSSETAKVWRPTSNQVSVN